jgi:parallel beta-helix repeat protein
MFVVLVVSLLMLGMLNTALPVFAKPTVIHVFAGQSIQAAVNAASPGDTIVVHAGTYRESIIVEKQLTLLSLGAIIDLEDTSFSDGINAAILVEASKVIVSGFTIRNVPPGPLPQGAPTGSFPGSFAIWFRSMGSSLSGGLIENNKITTDYFGIGVNDVSNVEVRNNRVTATITIGVDHTPNMVIRNNVVSAKANVMYPEPVPVGIVVSGVFSGGLIEKNQINSDFFGIVLNGQSNIEIRNNVVYTSITAIWLKQTPNVVVRGNILSAKASSIYPGPVNGISLMGSFSGGLIEKNQINSEQCGIWFSDQSNINVRNNMIYSSAIGIYGPEVIGLGDTLRSNVIYSSLGIVINGPSGAMALNLAVTGNIIHGEQAGINVWGTSNSIIQDNKVYVATFHGIEVGGIGNNVAFNKVFGNFENGIFILPGSMYNTIAKNTIIGGNVVGDVGIHLSSGTSKNTIAHNKISGVDTPISDEGTDNITN